jgi:hypothetical protein
MSTALHYLRLYWPIDAYRRRREPIMVAKDSIMDAQPCGARRDWSADAFDYQTLWAVTRLKEYEFCEKVIYIYNPDR